MPISWATENSIYVVMANGPAHPEEVNSGASSHGESKVIHPDGNVLVEVGIFTEKALIWNLDLKAVNGGVDRRAVNDVTCLRDWFQEGLGLVEKSDWETNGRAQRTKVLT